MIEICTEILSLEVSYTITSSVICSLTVGGFLFILLKFLLNNISDRNQESKYWLSYLTLASISVITIIFFYSILNNSNSEALLSNDIVFLKLTNNPFDNFTALSYVESGINLVLNEIFGIKETIAACWLMGLIFYSIKFCVSVFSVKSIKTGSEKINDKNTNELIRILSRKLRLRGNISITQSGKIITPIVIGFLKPVILFPIGLITNLPNKQIELIILHELAHIKRYDPFFKTLQTLMETVLFFNPFVKLISKEIDEAREKCCDDIAISIGCNKKTYAKTLVDLAEFSNKAVLNSLAFSNNKNQLLSRVKRLFKPVEELNKIKNGTVSNVDYALMISSIILLPILISGLMNLDKTYLQKSAEFSSLTSIENALVLLNQNSKSYTNSKSHIPDRSIEIKFDKIQDLLKDWKEIEFDDPYKAYNTSRENFTTEIKFDNNNFTHLNNELKELDRRLKYIKDKLNQSSIKIF